LRVKAPLLAGAGKVHRVDSLYSRAFAWAGSIVAVMVFIEALSAFIAQCHDVARNDLGAHDVDLLQERDDGRRLAARARLRRSCPDCYRSREKAEQGPHQDNAIPEFHVQSPSAVS
jgi:hypothetical protein